MRIIVLALMVLTSSTAIAQGELVRIIDANQATQCKFVDTIVANSRGADISDISSKARERAKAEASSLGANALVIKSLQPAGSFILLLADAYTCQN